MREEGCKDGAERHHSAASGGKLQVDPPYFEHGGCSAVAGFGRCLLGRHQRAPRAAGGHRPVKRLAEAPFAATATVGVLRMQSPDNSRVSRSIGTCIDLNRALGHRARSVGTQAHSGAKRRALPQTAAADGRDAATVCSADPTAPHQSWTSTVIPTHRCVGRELVRAATPGHPLCAAARCGRCPSARRRLILCESSHSGA